MGEKTQKKAYQRGQEDASSEEGKKFIRNAIKILTSPRAYLPGGDNFVNESVDYHTKGYNDGIRKINISGVDSSSGVNKGSSTTSKNNLNSQSNQGAVQMANTDLESVLESLENLRDSMIEWKDSLIKMQEVVDDTSEELISYGMEKQRHEFLRKKIFMPLDEELVEIIQSIKHKYLPVTEAEIEETKQQIDRYQ